MTRRLDAGHARHSLRGDKAGDMTHAVIETATGRYSIAERANGGYSVRRGGFVNTLVGYFATMDEAKSAIERERCATIALEQRCERGTPWDLACTTIADAIRTEKK